MKGQRMNAASKYYRGPFRYQIGANGHVQTGTQYSVIVDGTFYAIKVYADGSVAYQENGGNCNPEAAHISIAAHFDVPLAALHGSRAR
jgi:hypothetical protein